MKKKILFYILLFVPVFSFAQNENALKKHFRAYLEHPVYIVNTTYVIYQHDTTRLIIHPDMQTFRTSKFVYGNGIAMDKNGIYFQGEFIKTDIAEFHLVGRNNESHERWFWKSKDKVFCNNKEIKGADAATFRPLMCFDGAYFKDKNYVYYFDKKIDGSDGSTLVGDCDDRACDKNFVYNQGEIATYQGERLKPINKYLAKTATSVILDGKTVTNIDVATVKKLSASYSMDKNGVYYASTKLPVNPKDFDNVRVWEQGNRCYLSDGKDFYSSDAQDIRLSLLDAKSFRLLPYSNFMYDKNGIYKRQWIEKQDVAINAKLPFIYDDDVTSENTFMTRDGRYIIYKNQAYAPKNKTLFKNLTNIQIDDARAGRSLYLEKDFEGKDNPISILAFGFYLQNGKIKRLEDGEIITYSFDAGSFVPLSWDIVKDKNGIYETTYASSKLRKLLNLDAETLSPAYEPFLTDKNGLYYVGEKGKKIVGRSIKNITNGSIKTYSCKSLLSPKELVLLGIFTGYRRRCGNDSTLSSDNYLFRNIDGYWLIETTSPKISKTFLGKTFNRKWSPLFTNFELP